MVVHHDRHAEAAHVGAGVRLDLAALPEAKLLRENASYLFPSVGLSLKSYRHGQPFVAERK